MTDPIWMVRAGAAAGGVGVETVGSPGARHHVYVILLRTHAVRVARAYMSGRARSTPTGGPTSTKSDLKASSAARRFGVRLLPGLVAHLNPMMG
jgi:hypothetical protein